MTLTGKKIVIGVCGGIAAYKVCELASLIKRNGGEVKVIMTKNATRFVSPLTFEVLTGNPVVYDMFDRNTEWEVEHIELARWADAFVIAPATANVIGKIANGIADDMLTTTVMATESKLFVCPAMNTTMYASDACRENLATLVRRGAEIVEPDEGRLACGAEGKGRLPAPDVIFGKILDYFRVGDDFSGKTALITAGATSEPIDPVRFITNRSSGRMGIALANAFLRRGGKVILVAGNTSVDLPIAAEVIKVSTTQEMRDAVMSNLSRADIVIKAAAPSDYRVSNYASSKIKSEGLELKLVKNPDIAAEVGRVKGERKLVVFSAETDDLIANATAKLKKKNADLVVANDVTQAGAGFDVDTNIVTIIGRDGRVVSSGLQSKDEIAELILDNLK
ncbi:MAG: bifunctional phosphopantothenoylcysteine decarboxylase/phosphopantothenate--cysteine ligase CoaBC [Christensenellales bacterium]